MIARKVQKELFKVCYNVVKMKINEEMKIRVGQWKHILFLKFSNSKKNISVVSIIMIQIRC